LNGQQKLLHRQADPAEEFLMRKQKTDRQCCVELDALAGAVCSSQTEAVRFLLAHDADPDTMYHGYPLIYIAFCNGDDDIIRLLLAAGACVTRLEESTGHLSILDGAVRNGDEDLVDFALSITKLAGMDMKRLYTEGLISAVAENNLRLAQKFLDLGADPDDTGPNGCYGFPALQLATDRKNTDMVRLLVLYGAKAGLHLSSVQELLTGGR
jgi:ankyrin repeat protein